jgi:hypothetical protein
MSILLKDHTNIPIMFIKASRKFIWKMSTHFPCYSALLQSLRKLRKSEENSRKLTFDANFWLNCIQFNITLFQNLNHLLSRILFLIDVSISFFTGQPTEMDKTNLFYSFTAYKILDCLFVAIFSKLWDNCQFKLNPRHIHWR